MFPGRFLVALALSLCATNSLAHVEEVDIIDMVSGNKEKTEVFLGVVQQLPWTARTFGLLRRKVANYESYVLRGELQRKYPKTAGMQVTIEIAYFVEPDAEALAELQQLGSSLAPKGLKLRWFKLNAKG